MNRITSFPLLALFAACSSTSPVESQSSITAVSLGTAQSFAVLGGSTVTNTGPSTVAGNLGLSPGLAVVGFPPGLVVGGTIHAGDAVALQAQNDATTAYNTLAKEPCTQDLTGKDLGGMTLTKGVYCFSTSAQLTGTLTLDGGGSADAVFIFQIGSTLTTAAGSTVQLINNGRDCNVFWQVGTSATIGKTTEFVGDLIALSSITLTTAAHMSGAAIARNGAVTLDSNVITMASCGSSPDMAVTPIVDLAVPMIDAAVPPDATMIAHADLAHTIIPDMTVLPDLTVTPDLDLCDAGAAITPPDMTDNCTCHHPADMTDTCTCHPADLM